MLKCTCLRQLAPQTCCEQRAQIFAAARAALTQPAGSRCVPYVLLKRLEPARYAAAGVHVLASQLMRQNAKHNHRLLPDPGARAALRPLCECHARELSRLSCMKRRTARS